MILITLENAIKVKCKDMRITINLLIALLLL
jgi:hypothetical protein